MIDKKRKRRRVWSAIAIIAGLVLVALELARPPGGTTAGERWFWVVVGALLVGLGLADFMTPRERKD